MSHGGLLRLLNVETRHLSVQALRAGEIALAEKQSQWVEMSRLGQSRPRLRGNRADWKNETGLSRQRLQWLLPLRRSASLKPRAYGATLLPQDLWPPAEEL